MAVPKTTETRCRDGSVQSTHYTKTTQLTPSLHLFISEIILRVMLRDYWEEQYLSPQKRTPKKDRILTVSNWPTHTRYINSKTSIKTFSKNVEGCRDGSAKNYRN